MPIIRQECDYSLQLNTQDIAQTINYSQDLGAHAVLLAEFFGTIFDKRDRVLIVPGLDDTRFKEYCDNISSLPPEIAGRETTYYDKKKGRIMPRHFLDPFTRSPLSTKTTNLAFLHELNQFGYGIYFAINPMIGRRRCQKAVLMAKHILIESDRDDIEIQMAFLERFGGCVVSSVHSGGKSIHHLIRISPPRWNPHRVRNMKSAMSLGSETRASWPEYRKMADYWMVMASMVGVKADDSVCHDHARVSRVPGFLHQGTGKVAHIVRMNRDASWDWRTAMAGWIEGEEDYPDIEAHNEHMLRREASLGQEVQDLLAGDDGLFRSMSPFGRGRKEWWEDDVKQADDGGDMAQGKARGTWGDLVEDLERVDTATINVVRRTTHRAISDTPKTSFLDSVEMFDKLRAKGLAGRHTRRHMHQALFDTARVFGWDETQMSDEWAKVIKTNLSATKETIESAVADMLKLWGSAPGIRNYIPNLTSLTDHMNHRREVIEARLNSMGCKEALKGAKIILEVIFPLMRKLPQQCLTGSAGIHSRELRSASNIRGCRRDHKALWAWMQSAKIVECMNKGYYAGYRTRLYRINVPMVLWLAGFKTDELDWVKVKKIESYTHATQGRNLSEEWQPTGP